MIAFVSVRHSCSKKREQVSHLVQSMHSLFVCRGFGQMKTKINTHEKKTSGIKERHKEICANARRHEQLSIPNGLYNGVINACTTRAISNRFSIFNTRSLAVRKNDDGKQYWSLSWRLCTVYFTFVFECDRNDRSGSLGTITFVCIITIIISLCILCSYCERVNFSVSFIFCECHLLSTNHSLVLTFFALCISHCTELNSSVLLLRSVRCAFAWSINFIFFPLKFPDTAIRARPASMRTICIRRNWLVTHKSE